jgi:hypothetical protein
MVVKSQAIKIIKIYACKKVNFMLPEVIELKVFFARLDFGGYLRDAC